MEPRRPHSLGRSPDGAGFGVRVQVQGIKGQPFVVLNSAGQERHRDISVITHQAGCTPGVLRRCEEAPPPSTLHYQQHPEILRPYDPESNDLTGVVPPRPRIPLPAQGPVADQGEVAPPSGRGLPAHSPDSVETDSILSVGKLISRFNSTHQRGRGPPRSRLDPQQCRRSRSADSGRTSDSSGSSPSSTSSSRSSSLKGGQPETPGGPYPPGSARARLLGGENYATNKREEKKVTISTHAAKLLQRAEKSSVCRSCSDQTEDSDDRDLQVNTPTSTSSSGQFISFKGGPECKKHFYLG